MGNKTISSRVVSSFHNLAHRFRPLTSPSDTIAPAIATTTRGLYWNKFMKLRWGAMQQSNKTVSLIGKEGLANAGGVDPIQVASLWSFCSSGFALLTIALYLLINRIHAVVPARAVQNGRLSRLHRFGIRLPALVLLFRSIVSICSKLMEHSGTSIPYFGQIVRIMGWMTEWSGTGSEVGPIDHAGIMWQIFVASVVAVGTEHFVRSLIDDPSHQTTFNLVSFSYFLHSQTLSTPQDDFPTRLYYHLLLTVVELFSLHLYSVFSPPIRNLRLPITAVFSLIGQGFVISALADLFKGDTRQIGISSHNLVMSRSPDLISELIAGVTIVLKFLAVALRGEQLTLESVFSHRTHWPSMDQDYSVFMINYAIAMVQVDRLSGLANEVDPVATRIFSYIPFGSSLYSPLLPQIDVVELSRGGRSGALSERDATNEKELDSLKRKSRPREGLANEIVQIDAKKRRSGDDMDPLGGDPHRRRQFRKIRGLCGIAMLWVVWRIAVRSQRIYRRALAILGWKSDINAFEENWIAKRGADGDDLEDEDFVPSSDSETDDGEDTSDSSVGEGSQAEHVEPEDDGTVVLYSDLAQYQNQQSESDSFTSVLLAHNATSSSSPLTRNRYQSLLRPTPRSEEAFSDAINTRRRELEIASKELGAKERRARRDKFEETRQRLCVVCTSEERTIICWPCRCLALCEDCRDNLAERTAAQSHLCVTCRSPVNGFSRIYIP